MFENTHIVDYKLIMLKNKSSIMYFDQQINSLINHKIL